MEIPLFLSAQIVLSISVLGIGALMDLFNDNTVPNRLFVAYGIIGVVLAVLEYGATPLLGVHFLFAGCIGVGAWASWRLAKGRIGGADAKAIMGLGVSLPIFSVLILGYSAVFALIYWGLRTVKEKMKLRDALKISVPFLPFMFGGLLATIAVILLS